jgi:peptide chain release factor
MLEELRSEARSEVRYEQWFANQNLERGNPVRTYIGPRFTLKVV